MTVTTTLSRARMIMIVVATCGTAAAAFVVMGSIVVAVPYIGYDLRASQSDMQWVADSYPLALASTLLPAGVLADRFGRRRAMILGLLVATVGMVLAGIADGSGQLIAALVVAGIGSGIAFPSTLSTINVVIPQEQRQWAVGLWSATVPGGGIIGALIGGVMVEVASWREIYLVVGCVTVAALVVTVLVVPETREHSPTRFDALGTALSVVGVAALVLGVTEGPVHGWESTRTLALLGIGVVGLVLFVLWELHTDHPMLDVRLFALPSFGTAAASIFVVFAIVYGLISMWFYYQAFVLGYDSLESAVGMVPVTFTMVPCALAGAALARRFGTKRIMVLSLVCGALAGPLAAYASGSESYWPVIPAILLFGACLGLGAGPVTEVISTELPAAKQGVASAVNSISRELGATIGIAICGTAFNTGYRGDIESTLDTGTDPLAAASHSSPAAGLQAAAQAGPDAGRYVDAIAGAAATGFSYAMITVSGAAAIVLVFCQLRYPSPRRTAMLSGTVLAPDGSPLPGARLTLLAPAGHHRARAFTAADGTYRIPAPADGELLVCAADGMRPFIGSPNGRVQLRGTSDVSGQVRVGTVPTAGSSIMLLDAGGTVRGRTRTDAAGRYLFEGHPAGRFTVVVSDDGAPPRAADVELTPDAVVQHDVDLA